MTPETAALVAAVLLVAVLALAVLCLAALAEANRLRAVARHLREELARRDRELACLTGGVSDEVAWKVARRLGALLGHRDREIDGLRRELARLEVSREKEECRGR